MFKKIFNTLVTRVLSAVASLLIAVVVSRFMGASGKGEQSLIITTIVMIMLASNLLSGAAMVYLSPRFPLLKLVIPAAIWSCLIGCLAYVAMLFIPVVQPAYRIDVAAISVIATLNGIMVNILIGRERIALANLLNLIQPLITLAYLVCFLLWFSELTLSSYVQALYLAYSIPALAGLTSLRQDLFFSKPAEDISWIRIVGRMWHYGLMNQLSHIFQLMSFRLGYYFLDAYTGAANLGKYSNAVALMEGIWLISKSIALVQYARIANSTDKGYKQALTLELARFTGAISFIGVVILCLLPSGIYVWLFGEEFTGLPRMMLTLAPGILSFSWVLIFGHYFSGNGQYYKNTIASMVGFVVMLGLSLLLIPIYGAYGAGISASLSYMTTAFLTIRFFRKDDPFAWKELSPSRTDYQRFVAALKEYASNATAKITKSGVSD